MKMMLNYYGFSYVAQVEDGLVKSLQPSNMGGGSKGNSDIGKLKPNLASFTEFERRIMKWAMKIPPGKVTTYGELARALGKPRASRAVGNVMAKNPIPIIVPCHRVVKSDLSIGQYAHGSETKESLLRAEGVVIENGRVRADCVHRF